MELKPLEMDTSAVGHHSEAGYVAAQKKQNKAVKKTSSPDIKEKQRAEFKEGLTEAILISRGEIEGTPLSDIWDE